MRRVLCALAVLALVVTGCTKSQPAPPPTESPTPSPTPEPPPIAPLTGEELSDAVDRSVLAIKIDNASAALPPAGLEDADIVFEEEVEGGLTRFLALFHSKDPGEIGPVRSGRSVDADLLPPFNAALALSGASNRTERVLRQAGVHVIEDDDLPEAFSREPDRVAPHDLFAQTAPLFEAAEELAAPEEPVFAFSEDVPDGGDDTTSVELVFSSFANATWTWDEDQDEWHRQQNGSEHATAQGRTIGTDNVVIMRVQTRQGAERDAGGNPTVDVDVIGRGRGLLLRDGRAFAVRWRKRSADEQLEWLTPQGDPLPLRPGQTWVEMLNQDGSMDVQRPRGRGGEGTEQAGD